VSSLLPLDTNVSLHEFGHDPWWLVIIKRVADLPDPRAAHPVQHLVGAARWWPACSTASAPTCTARSACWQSLADGVKLALKGRHHPEGGRQAIFILGAGHRHRPGVRDLLGDPLRTSGEQCSGRETPLQLTDMPVAVIS